MGEGVHYVLILTVMTTGVTKFSEEVVEHDTPISK